MLVGPEKGLELFYDVVWLLRYLLWCATKRNWSGFIIVFCMAGEEGLAFLDESPKVPG